MIENGKMKFSGQPNSSESVGVATTAMLEVDSDAGQNVPESTDPHSILEFVESQGSEWDRANLLFAIELSDPHRIWLIRCGLFCDVWCFF